MANAEFGIVTGVTAPVKTDRPQDLPLSMLLLLFLGCLTSQQPDTPTDTLPGAWRYRVGTGASWPGVSIL